MSMRQGYVVDTHPSDNAVDLVMADTGERLVGVKVIGGGASARTGGIDLPEVPKRKNKWDVSEQTDQDMIAAVGYLGRQPVVMGFVYPPANQMGIKDKRTLYRRHQSDVQWSIDGEGNIQLAHPGGAYIRIGENPDQAQIATAQASANNRNTGRKVNVRIGLAGNAVVVTLTPDGDITVALDRDMQIDAKGKMLMNTQKTFELHAKGDITVTSSGAATVTASGNITANAGGSVQVTAGGRATISTGSNATINAPSGVSINTRLLSVSGDVVASDYHKR